MLKKPLKEVNYIKKAYAKVTNQSKLVLNSYSVLTNEIMLEKDPSIVIRGNTLVNQINTSQYDRTHYHPTTDKLLNYKKLRIEIYNCPNLEQIIIDDSKFGVDKGNVSLRIERVKSLKKLVLNGVELSIDKLKQIKSMSEVISGTEDTSILLSGTIDFILQQYKTKSPEVVKAKEDEGKRNAEESKKWRAEVEADYKYKQDQKSMADARAINDKQAAEQARRDRESQSGHNKGEPWSIYTEASTSSPILAKSLKAMVEDYDLDSDVSSKKLGIIQFAFKDKIQERKFKVLVKKHFKEELQKKQLILK